MTKISFVWVFVVVLSLAGCSHQVDQCLVCGEFNLVNFSKKDFSRPIDKDVSIRRTLNLSAFSGKDHYTIWFWNQLEPDSSWTEQMQKEVTVAANKMKINEDGTWEWTITLEEYFETTPCFGTNEYRVRRNYVESGTWDFGNYAKDVIVLNREELVMENGVDVLNKSNWEKSALYYPYNKRVRYADTKGERFFDIRHDEANNQITLVTRLDDKRIYSKGIHDPSWSLIEGDIRMTLSTNEPAQNLAAKN